MSDSLIRTERQGAVALLTINRPEKRNALNAALRAALIEAVRESSSDDSVRVVALTGAGDKAFVAGADIGEFAARTPLEQRSAMEAPRVFEVVAECPKPVIALVNGLALGGGCELAMACDFRIAADTARLGQPEIRLGLIPGGGGTQRLPRLIGMGQAMRLILSGEAIDADEALRIGLVDMVVPAEDLRSRGLEVAERIAAHSPVALRLAKQAVRASGEMSLAAGLALERELFVAAFTSEDASEGVRAFMEKRPPTFRGR